MSWYYAVNGQQAGPIEEAELRGLVAAGFVTESTLVWQPGMEAWAALGALMTWPAAGPTHRCQHCRRAWTLEQLIPLQGGLICAECKPVVVQRVREGVAPLVAAKHFAGFWIRLVARMIDNTITSIVGYVFQIPMLVVLASTSGKKEPDMAMLFGTGALAIVLSLGSAAYYEAWFLVKKGATPGKMIVGLKVVRARGGTMTWKLAVGRYFAHLLSAFTLYIGYMMAGWDEEKRALHDRICDTRVVTGS